MYLLNSFKNKMHVHSIQNYQYIILTNHHYHDLNNLLPYTDVGTRDRRGLWEVLSITPELFPQGYGPSPSVRAEINLILG